MADSPCEWPSADWPKAVEAIRARYPSLAAGSALAVLAEAGWTLTPPEYSDGTVSADDG